MEGQVNDSVRVTLLTNSPRGNKGDVVILSRSVALSLISRGIARHTVGSVTVPDTVTESCHEAPVPQQFFNASTFVIVSHRNGCGLEVDVRILKGILDAAGKHVTVEPAYSPGNPSFRKVNVVIFNEIFDNRWLPFSSHFWVIPNSEWWRQDWDRFLPRVERVLCKTKDCFDVWTKRVPSEKCMFIGFESIDFYNPDISRKREFLHLAGGSINKGSAEVIRAWRDFRIPYHLTVVGSNTGFDKSVLIRGVQNISYHQRLDDLSHLMNECLFHILPSRYEGWGHVLHEGLGCGAIMLTTDAAPMNEATGLSKQLLVPVDNVDHFRVPKSNAGGSSITNMYNVVPVEVNRCVRAAYDLSEDKIAELSSAARSGFLKDREEFRSVFSSLITPSAPKPVPEVTTESSPDLVLVTTFFRPEYLWLCLNAVHSAEGGQAKEVWVAQDHHSDDRRSDAHYVHQSKENDEVIAHFQDKFKAFRFINRTSTHYDGNSYNCLELYREAYASSQANLVYLVEDDIFVEKDFFRWHEAAQSAGKYLCSIGRLHTVRTDVPVSDDPNDYVESSSDYTSWGVCWKRQNLARLVKHCCAGYYSNMPGYIARVFPNSPLGSMWTEQDGLIRRILMESNGSLLTASPCLKRAYHIGITGYHRSRGHHFTGNLMERVQQLDCAVNSGHLPNLRGDFLELNDIDVPRGSTPEWSKLRCVGRMK